MLTEQRHSFILNRINKNESVTVIELVELLNTSESTIRRDLNFLDKEGKLRKVHGGATSCISNLNTNEEINEVKQTLNIDDKKAIAKLAASLINDNDLIYIDAGTTTELMIDFIHDSKATFITNGIGHAKKLIKNKCKVYILGGELKITTEAIIGIDAINGLKKYNFTKGFFGVNGVHIEKGFTTPDIREAHIKEEAISRCNEAFIICDKSKFNKVTPITFANIKKATIITANFEDTNYSKYTKIMEVEK